MAKNYIDEGTKRLIEILQQRADRFSELENRLADPNLSRNPKELERIGKEHARARESIMNIRLFLKTYQQLLDAQALMKSEDKISDLYQLAQEECEELAQRLQTDHTKMEGLLLDSDENDGLDLILEIRAATGGAEAALFVGDLLRMYTYFAQRHKVKIEMINVQPTGIGGYKEIIAELKGKNAYNYFHQEAGTHRVQRVPVTEASGRIHTSTVTVAILPVKKESEIQINSDDLQIDVYRASGAGGQHVNTTESAIRITHIPSGMSVTCQDERSQHKNKAKAMKVLFARLAKQQEIERHAKETILKRQQIKSGERSERIRTYNFPQGRLTDHRIGFNAYNLNEIMDGAMAELTKALLNDKKKRQIADLVIASKKK